MKRSESDSSRSRSRSKSKSGRSRSRSNSMDSRSNSRSNSRSASGSPDRVVERASSSKDTKKEKDRKDRKRKEARSRHKSGSNSKSTTAIVNSGPPHQVGKLFPNIYERPIGPRTGIGYPEADVIEIRFLVPSKISGSIIGKKGDYVQKLRKDFQIGVGIPDSPNNYLERVCVIRGASVRNVIDCCCAIADYPLKKEMNAGLKIEKHHTQIRLLMHQSVCGAIIGKKASQILEIRNMSGADVQVCSYNCPGTTDRVVKVTGSITEIRDALALIFKFTGDQNVKGVENNYLAILPDPENNEDPGQYFGWTDDEVELMGADVDTRKRGTMAARKIVEVELDRHGKPRMDNLTENSRAKLNGMPPQKQYAKFGPKKDYFDSSNTTGQQYQGENSAKLKVAFLRGRRLVEIGQLDYALSKQIYDPSSPRTFTTKQPPPTTNTTTKATVTVTTTKVTTTATTKATTKAATTTKAITIPTMQATEKLPATPEPTKPTSLPSAHKQATRLELEVGVVDEGVLMVRVGVVTTIRRGMIRVGMMRGIIVRVMGLSLITRRLLRLLLQRLILRGITRRLRLLGISIIRGWEFLK